MKEKIQVPKNGNGLYQSSLLLSKKQILHGFTTRVLGDMRILGNRNLPLFRASGVRGKIVVMDQVHGSRVVRLPRPTREKADAMVLPSRSLGNRSRSYVPILAVFTADCVPLLFYDPVMRVIGIAHAGWRGTLKRIASRVIDVMVSLGSRPKNIVVCLGPSIGPCCYYVDSTRSALFKKHYSPSSSVVSEKEGMTSLDLSRANVSQLTEAGVTTRHIDDLNYCTSCRPEEFYSFRRDKTDLEGEMMSFIGFSPLL